MRRATRICAVSIGCCGTATGTLICTGLTLVATIWLYVMIPKGFLPQQDTGLLVGVTDAAQDISFATMAERQRALADSGGARSCRARGGQLRWRRHSQSDAEHAAGSTLISDRPTVGATRLRR